MNTVTTVICTLSYTYDQTSALQGCLEEKRKKAAHFFYDGHCKSTKCSCAILCCDIRRATQNLAAVSSAVRWDSPLSRVVQFSGGRVQVYGGENIHLQKTV